MGKEQPPGFYDNIFQIKEHFQVHYKDSYYWVHWTQVIKFIRKNPELKILEIGCGTGQLAEYLYDEGFSYYHGFDFSEVAIEKAKKRVPEFNFFLANALSKEPFTLNFDVVICLEVFEHIKNDLKVLQNIPEGKIVIFSVPKFDNPGHVRWFTSERQVKKRYYRFIDIKQLIRIGNIYIVYGIRNNFKPKLFQRFLKSREKVKVSSFTNRLKHRFKNLLK